MSTYHHHRRFILCTNAVTPPVPVPDFSVFGSSCSYPYPVSTPRVPKHHRVPSLFFSRFKQQATSQALPPSSAELDRTESSSIFCGKD